MQSASTQRLRGSSQRRRCRKATAKFLVMATVFPVIVTVRVLAGSPQTYDRASYSGQESREASFKVHKISADKALEGWRVRMRNFLERGGIVV